MRNLSALLASLCLLFLPLVAGAQGMGANSNTVAWSANAVHLEGNRYEVQITATIAPSWHLYSTVLPEGGPTPTTFTFAPDPAYRLDGDMREEGHAVTEHDEVFNLDLTMYEGNVTFVQPIVAEGGSAFTVRVTAEFQTCHDGACNVGEQDLSVEIVPEGATPSQAVATAAPSSTQEGGAEESSMFVFLIISFLAGLAGLLTPCVFPMIPMTVSFFLGKKNRLNALLNALTFGLSIVAIYTLLGFLVSLAGLGAGFITDVTTHWITNLIFFLLFAVFAAAFFGMFEIRLPSSLSSKTDSQVDRGGFLGSFFFALTTVIVSLSCVGPIVGGLLIEGATGSAAKPVLGMFAFSLGFSLPFTLFAIFPTWLNKLPKSGGWMNSVKIVLGYIVLAFSLKFLLGVDTFFGLGLLTRPVYIAIWVAFSIMLVLYLLGLIRFKMDSPTQHVGFLRMILATAVLAFAMYLSTGLFGAPLTSLSGFMPAPSPDDFTINAPQAPAHGGAMGQPAAALCEAPKYADFIHMPANLDGYRDYKQALACAKEKGKPLFVEFTGHGCSNCKVMAAQVLSKPNVAQLLMDKFIVTALYVDDKHELPESEWYVSVIDGKTKKTIGKQNLDLQAAKFHVSGQPYFFVVSPNEEVLAGPYAFNTDVNEFIKFLESGLAKSAEPAAPAMEPMVEIQQ